MIAWHALVCSCVLHAVSAFQSIAQLHPTHVQGLAQYDVYSTPIAVHQGGFSYQVERVSSSVVGSFLEVHIAAAYMCPQNGAWKDLALQTFIPPVTAQLWLGFANSTGGPAMQWPGLAADITSAAGSAQVSTAVKLTLPMFLPTSGEPLWAKSQVWQRVGAAWQQQPNEGWLRPALRVRPLMAAGRTCTPDALPALGPSFERDFGTDGASKATLRTAFLTNATHVTQGTALTLRIDLVALRVLGHVPVNVDATLRVLVANGTGHAAADLLAPVARLAHMPELDVPEATRVVVHDMCRGDRHGCSILRTAAGAHHSVRCWGNPMFSMGNPLGTGVMQHIPRADAWFRDAGSVAVCAAWPNATVCHPQAIVCGTAHVCAQVTVGVPGDTSDDVACWGGGPQDNVMGAAAAADGYALVPTAVPARLSGTQVTHIAAVDTRTCVVITGLAQNAQLRCFGGTSANSELGAASAGSALVDSSGSPVLWAHMCAQGELCQARALVMSSTHACVLLTMAGPSSAIRCWGDNALLPIPHQISRSPFPQANQNISDAPSASPRMTNLGWAAAVGVAAGKGFTCGVLPGFGHSHVNVSCTGGNKTAILRMQWDHVMLGVPAQVRLVADQKVLCIGTQAAGLQGRIACANVMPPIGAPQVQAVQYALDAADSWSGLWISQGMLCVARADGQAVCQAAGTALGSGSFTAMGWPMDQRPLASAPVLPVHPSHLAAGNAACRYDLAGRVLGCADFATGLLHVPLPESGQPVLAVTPSVIVYGSTTSRFVRAVGVRSELIYFTIAGSEPVTWETAVPSALCPDGSLCGTLSLAYSSRRRCGIRWRLQDDETVLSAWCFGDDGSRSLISCPPPSMPSTDDNFIPTPVMGATWSIYTLALAETGLVPISVSVSSSGYMLILQSLSDGATSVQKCGFGPQSMSAPGQYYHGLYQHAGSQSYALEYTEAGIRKVANFQGSLATSTVATSNVFSYASTSWQTCGSVLGGGAVCFDDAGMSRDQLSPPNFTTTDLFDLYGANCGSTESSNCASYTWSHINLCASKAGEVGAIALECAGESFSPTNNLATDLAVPAELPNATVRAVSAFGISACVVWSAGGLVSGHYLQCWGDGRAHGFGMNLQDTYVVDSPTDLLDLSTFTDSAARTAHLMFGVGTRAVLPGALSHLAGKIAAAGAFNTPAATSTKLPVAPEVLSFPDTASSVRLEQLFTPTMDMYCPGHTAGTACWLPYNHQASVYPVLPANVSVPSRQVEDGFELRMQGVPALLTELAAPRDLLQLCNGPRSFCAPITVRASYLPPAAGSCHVNERMALMCRLPDVRLPGLHLRWRVSELPRWWTDRTVAAVWLPSPVLLNLGVTTEAALASCTDLLPDSSSCLLANPTTIQAAGQHILLFQAYFIGADGPSTRTLMQDAVRLVEVPIGVLAPNAANTVGWHAARLASKTDHMAVFTDITAEFAGEPQGHRLSRLGMEQTAVAAVEPQVLQVGPPGTAAQTTVQFTGLGLQDVHSVVIGGVPCGNITLRTSTGDAIAFAAPSHRDPAQAAASTQLQLRCQLTSLETLQQVDLGNSAVVMNTTYGMPMAVLQLCSASSLASMCLKPRPQVLSLSPSQLLSAASTAWAMLGTNFDPAGLYTGQPATLRVASHVVVGHVVSDTEVRFTVPPVVTAGALAELELPSGWKLNNSATVVRSTPLAIGTLKPWRAFVANPQTPAFATMHVTGEGFGTNATHVQVQLGTTACAIASISVLAGEQVDVECLLPLHQLNVGDTYATLTVSAGGYMVQRNNMLMLMGKPVVDSVSPALLPVAGGRITLQGRNFPLAGAQVAGITLSNGAACTGVTVNSSLGTVECDVPPGVGSGFTAALSTAFGWSHASATQLHYTAGTVTAILFDGAEIMQLAPGAAQFAAVQLRGASLAAPGMAPALASVTIGGVPCPTINASYDSITCGPFVCAGLDITAPELQVSIGGQAATPGVVLSILEPPTLSSVVPPSGQGGASLVLSGAGFMRSAGSGVSAVERATDLLGVTMGSEPVSCSTESAVSTVLQCTAPYIDMLGLAERTVNLSVHTVAGIARLPWTYGKLTPPTGTPAGVRASRPTASQPNVVELTWEYTGSMPLEFVVLAVSAQHARTRDDAAALMHAADESKVLSATIAGSALSSAEASHTQKLPLLPSSEPFWLAVYPSNGPGAVGAMSTVVGPLLETCSLSEYLQSHLALEQRICTACPPGLSCGGQPADRAAVLPGFARLPSDSLGLTPIECPEPANCQGSSSSTNNTAGMTACAPGYDGIACTSCAVGHTRDWSGSACSKCASPALAACVLVLGILVGTAVVLAVAASAVKSPPSADDQSSVLSKLIVGHLQQVALMSGFNLRWRSPLPSTFSGFKSAAAAGGALMRADCMLSYSQAAGDAGDMTPLRLQVVLALLTPLFHMAVWGAGAFALLHVLRRKRPGTQLLNQPFAAVLGTGVVVILYTAHTAITSATLQLFSCVTLGSADASMSVLAAEWDTECSSSGALAWRWGVGAPALLAYVIGIPLGMFLALRHSMRAAAQHDAGSSEAEEAAWKTRALQFIRTGYGDHAWWCEPVIMARRAMLASVIVITAPLGLQAQAVLAIAVLIAALTFQLRAKPYLNKQSNLYEETSLLISCGTLLGGLLLEVPRLGEVTATCVTVLIMGANLAFLGVLLWHRLQASMDQIASSKLGQQLLKRAGKRMSSQGALQVSTSDTAAAMSKPASPRSPAAAEDAQENVVTVTNVLYKHRDSIQSATTSAR